MGNSNSRPKICQVAPSDDQASEDEPSLLPASKWMITTVQGTATQEKRILGQRKSNHLQPLIGKQEAPHDGGIESGSQSICDKTGESIIKSHPPQPTKGWQPMASMAFDVNAYMADSKDTEWRDGPVHRFSTPSQSGHYGTTNKVQGNMKGLLLAQTMLSRQATKKRQAQQRCFRERRGRQKRVYTSDMEGNAEDGRQRVRLVSRPTQRNIFWDESEGQILDVRDLLQPSPEMTDSEDVIKDKPQMDCGFLAEVEDWKFEGPMMKSCRAHLDKDSMESTQRSRDLPWLKDRWEIEEKHPATKNLRRDGKGYGYGRYFGMKEDSK